MLMKWGMERADDLSLPCYIEATPDAKDLYVKYGFEVVELMKLEIPSRDDYHHFCMIRQANA
jgi:predicted GNAT family N-acyltransferase